MTAEEECIHGLTRETCSICLHGPTRPPADTSECRSCHAEILWVVIDKSHKRMPLDVDASDDGKFIKVRRDPNGEKIVHALTRDEVTDRPRYHSHYATCPDSDSWRNR